MPMCRRGHRQRQAERRGRYFLFTPGLSHAIPPCFVCPDCPSCPSGRPVLPSRTARFAMSNGLYCNALWPRWLRAADALAISSYIRRPAAVDMWRRGGAVAAVGAALAGVQPVRPCFVVSAVLKCGLNLAEMYRKSLKKLINVQNQAILCRYMYADWRKCCIFHRQNNTDHVFRIVNNIVLVSNFLW